MCSNNTGTLNSVLLILFVNSSLGVDLHQESLRGEKESYYYLIWVVCSTPGFYGNLTWEKYKPSRRRHWHPTPVLLPGKSHGRRSLVGCSPWDREVGHDWAEQLHFHFSLSCIGEGNGNPLRCSCLENSRDRRAWWASVYGITQSRTWLKQLSSSGSNVVLIFYD